MMKRMRRKVCLLISRKKLMIALLQKDPETNEACLMTTIAKQVEAQVPQILIMTALIRKMPGCGSRLYNPVNNITKTIMR